MTPAQLASLTYFRDGERDLAGRTLDWTQGDYETLLWLEQIRRRLDSPISIIRLAHPGKPTAVDWCCPGVRYRQVVMAVLRLPSCSYGFYSGGAVHVDRREYSYLPARWLAVRPSQRAALQDRGLLHLAGTEANGWLYLAWDFDALQLVIQLAERADGEPSTA